MLLQESRIERAERRVREAEANVERQRAKLLIEVRGDHAGLRSGRHILQSFRDALAAMKLRLREARAKRLRQSNLNG